MVGNGTTSWAEAKSSVRRYARILQKLGYMIHLTRIQLTTMSAVYKFSTTVDYRKLLQYPGMNYEPELFHAPILKKNNLSFTIFQSGKVVMTGIRENLNVTVNPTLMELELFISNV